MDVKSSSLLINIRNATVLNVLTINILEFNLADSGDCTDALKLTGVKSDWTAAGNSAEYCNTAANLGNMKYLTTNESAVQISFVTDDANNGTGFLLHYTGEQYYLRTKLYSRLKILPFILLCIEFIMKLQSTCMFWQRSYLLGKLLCFKTMCSNQQI